MTDTRDGRDIVERLRHAPVVFGTEMFGATRLLEDAASEIERLRSQRVEVREWQDISTAPTEAPDWLWYGEMDDGFPLITFGRWRKHGCQSGYIKTDADDFNSKNDPKYALSAERARVIEECAAIADKHHDTERDPYSKASAAHIAIAIRALAHGDSNDR